MFHQDIFHMRRRNGQKYYSSNDYKNYVFKLKYTYGCVSVWAICANNLNSNKIELIQWGYTSIELNMCNEISWDIRFI